MNPSEQQRQDESGGPAPLTADAILNLPKGLDLDILIAERVLGIQPRMIMPLGGTERVRVWNDALKDGIFSTERLRELGLPKDYSEEDGVAMCLVPALEDRGWLVSIARSAGYPLDLTRLQWVVEFRRQGRYHAAWHPDSLALALCRAALLTTLGKP